MFGFGTSTSAQRPAQADRGAAVLGLGGSIGFSATGSGSGTVGSARATMRSGIGTGATGGGVISIRLTCSFGIGSSRTGGSGGTGAMCTKGSSVCGRGSITEAVAPAKVITARIADAWTTPSNGYWR